MNEYFQGAVTQLVERGRHLLSVIPRGMPREFHLLEQTTRRRIGEEIEKLAALISTPLMQSARTQPERLRRFRRVVRELDFLETVCISALQRSKNHDVDLNKLIERVRMEIRYPLLPPVISPLSQMYFHIYPEYNLLRVPLVEGSFLLHLPDLYHELAHPLIVEKHDPSVARFHKHLLRALDQVFTYFADEQTKEGRRQGRSPELYVFYLDQWQKAWFGGWAIEFFCDSFAVLTLGPAFGWSHLHLHSTRGQDAYSVPTIGGFTDHPPDAARMTVILCCLRRTGFLDEANEIERRWNELLGISGAKLEPEYLRCFPKFLLEELVKEAFAAVDALGCRIATPDCQDAVHLTLNQAWIEFWRDPQEYANWERTASAQLRTQATGATVTH